MRALTTILSALLSASLTSSTASAEPTSTVEGLSREFDVDATTSPITVRPIRWRLLAIGLAAVSGGSIGVTLASHWATPLDGRGRLIAGLSGLGLLAVAIPLITRSSVSVGGGVARGEQVAERPERLRLTLGLEQVGGLRLARQGLRVSGGLGYQLPESRLTIELRGSLEPGVKGIAARMGPRIEIARLPIISVHAAAGLGFASAYASVGSGDEIGERKRERGLSAEASAAIRVEVPFPLKPELSVGYEVSKLGTWRGELVFAAAGAVAF